MTALVVASSGTAIAAGLVSGDKLIKKHSLSGNRLRNHTVTGTQVNLKKLGKVPSAKNADHATTATSATKATTATKATSATTATIATAAITAGSATNATNATNAVNAAALGGQAASAYETAVRTGLVTATSGQTVALATFGAFTLKLKCTAGTGAAVSAEIDATSTVANSDGYGIPMTTAGTSYTVVAPLSSGTTFNENDDNAADFLTTTAGQTYIANLTVGQNFPGAAAGCFANAVVLPS
ncbi:MAG TPA: hypothetical protein VG275_00790 [Solirubrobacteraceae bacterium]|nr:hypothetical protein [Solirubrobacteraceae bacterium]